MVVGFSATVASATSLDVNVVVNGNAETGDTTGWTTNTGIIATMDLTPDVPFGSYSFTGATGGTFEIIRQTFDLSGHASIIDSGNLAFELSAQLQNRTLGAAMDQVDLILGFRDGIGDLIGEITLTDPTAPSGVFDWDSVFTSGILNASTRLAELTLAFSRNSGASTDAYADDISLVFSDTSISPVPLPAAFPLLIGGLGMLGLLGWRRNRNAVEAA